jgi:hypothetical protein
LSETYFTKPISSTTIQQKLFKSILSVPKKLSDPIYADLTIPLDEDEFEVYNRSKCRISKESLGTSGLATFILRPVYLFISPLQAYFSIQVSMCLLHNQTPKRNLRTMSIYASDEDIDESNQESLTNDNSEESSKKFDLGI